MSINKLAALHRDDALNAAWEADIGGVAMSWVPRDVIDGWTK